MRRPVVESDVSLFIHQTLLHLQQRVLRMKEKVEVELIEQFSVILLNLINKLRIFHLDISRSKIFISVWIQLSKTFNNLSKRVLNEIMKCELSNLKGLKNAHATKIIVSSTKRLEDCAARFNLPLVNRRFLFTLDEPSV